MPKKLCGSVRWSRHRWPRHRKDGVPKKLCGSNGGLGTGKVVCLRNFVAQ